MTMMALHICRGHTSTTLLTRYIGWRKVCLQLFGHIWATWNTLQISLGFHVRLPLDRATGVLQTATIMGCRGRTSALPRELPG